jgi:hypothetical protein
MILFPEVSRLHRKIPHIDPLLAGFQPACSGDALWGFAAEAGGKLDLYRDRAGEGLAAVAEVMGLDAISAGQRAGNGEDFGAIPLGEVAADVAAALAARLAVIDRFADRVDHPQVDVGVVRIPGEHHAQVGLERGEEFLGNGERAEFRCRFRAGDEGVEFVQGDEVDVGEAAMPVVGGDEP